MKNESNLGHILFIGDELNWLDFAKAVLSKARYDVRTTQDATGGWEILHDEQFELVLVDLKKVEQEEKSFRKAAELQAERGHRIVVMFPTELTPEKVGAILKMGAHDCVDKQYDKSGLLALVQGQLAKKPAAILIVEDDEDWRKRLVHYLKAEPYQLETAGDFSSAMDRLEESLFDVIILDLRLIEEGEDFEGMKLLQRLKKQGSDVAVIVVSAYGTVEHVKDGFNVYNIRDYISKQRFDPDKYRKAVQEAVRQRLGRR